MFRSLDVYPLKQINGIMFRSLDVYPLKQYKNKLKVLCLGV
jgi:hypothetical protein